MSTRAARSLRLQVTCLNPQPALDPNQPHEFGLQDRKQHLTAGVLQPNGALRFCCDATVKARAQSDAPDFVGSYIHGLPGARFLYLSWRRRGAKDWLQRIKIPLMHITWEQIEAVQPGSVLAARIAGDRSGSVPLLDGCWIITAESED